MKAALYYHQCCVGQLPPRYLMKHGAGSANKPYHASNASRSEKLEKSVKYVGRSMSDSQLVSKPELAGQDEDSKHDFFKRMNLDRDDAEIVEVTEKNYSGN